MSELGGFICHDLVAGGERKKEDHSNSTHPAEAPALLSACPRTPACKAVLTPKIWTFMVYDAYCKVKEEYILNCVWMTNA